MATPIWDKLHLRLAAGARDSVATAATAGKDLSVSDRDGYLNSAFAKYVLLAFNLYKNDPPLLRAAFQSMVKQVQLTAAAGTISSITSTAADYGLFIDMVATSGGAVKRLSSEDFYNIKNLVSKEIVATVDSQFCLPFDNSILLLPATISGNYNVTYIANPITIVQNGATDFPLSEAHFDVVLDFALWYFYKDKQEFAVAESYLKDGYTTAPFPLVKSDK